MINTKTNFDKLCTMRFILYSTFLIACFSVTSFLSYAMSSNVTISGGVNLLLQPDTLAVDTLPTTIDTIKTVEIYEFGDSAKIITVGLDTILLFHSETATNYIEEGGIKMYYLGEEETTLDFNSLIDTSEFYVAVDTVYFENTTTIDSFEITLDTSVTLDTTISGFLVNIDTVFFYNDTINYFFANDSMAYYIPAGGKKIYKLNSQLDTTALVTGKINATSATQMAIVSTLDITHSGTRIFLGGIPKEINKGLFGFTLEGNFLPGHLPESEVLEPGAPNPEAWNWLADLKPSSLRFPGGANGKFMHLLPYDTNGDGINDKTPNGYGYDINEIIDFYDLSNNTKEVGCAACSYTYAQVKADIADGDADISGGIWETCVDFIDSKYDGDITSFYKKWDTQDELPPSEKPYIDEFIDLVNIIELANNYKIDIIVDINILSASASQSAEIINYMRNAGLNVVGVEIGNECYFKWLSELMYIYGFDEYWDYINGANVTLSNAVPDWVVADHNYLNAFRTGAFATNPIKIGIPAENPGEVDDDGNVVTSDWNLALGNKVNNDIENNKFDAVIIHNYFDAQKHWQNIPQQHMCLEYPNIGYPSCNTVACEAITYPLWRYDIYDGRLENAFNGFLGVNSNLPGNLRHYLKEDYYTDFNLIKEQLKVGNLLPGLTNNGIEIWNTEKNIKDKIYIPKDSIYSADTINRMQNLNSIYNNSFPHGLFMQEWFLNDLKLNYKGMYGNDFITYGHYHNFAGGSWSDMLVSADCGDYKNFVDENGLFNPISGSLYTGKNHYLRRTTYWTMKLLSEITKNDLKYLPSDMQMSNLNPNLTPTIFVKPNNYIYIYYSNMKFTSDVLEVYTNDIADLFEGNRTFDKLIGRGIYNIKVDYNYMSSGKNSLITDDNDKSVNGCYDCSIANSHPFDIYGIQVEAIDMIKQGSDPGVYKITVPGNSYGYIKLEIKWNPVTIGKSADANSLQDFDLELAPNPSNDYFNLQSEYNLFKANEPIYIEVYNLTGQLVLNTNIYEDELVDVSTLPSGVYLVQIINSTLAQSISKQLIKTN